MNNNTTNNIIKYIIIAGLAIIPFIPIYVANSMFFPFITGKAFVFRIIVEIIFSLWLVLVLREKGTSVAGTDRSVSLRINKVTIFVTLFTFIVLIADLFGVNPLRSIWSNSERMEGWMTIVHLWGYFVVLTSVFGYGEVAKKNWLNFFNVILISATVTAIYGLVQFFGWAQIHQGSTRVDASLGNSAYMAVYMLINAFIAAFMAFTKSSKKALVWVYAILSAFFSFILLQTATRGSILGWLIAIILSCAIYVLWGRKEKGQSNKSRIIASSIILFILIVGGLFYSYRDAKWIQNNEVLARMASISISDTKTQARGFVWPMAVKGSFQSIKTSIIGWGQENFNYIFNANYNPKMYSHEQWFDRAHSVYLDWLVAGGLLGLLSYLILYIISLIYICKSDLKLTQKSILISLLVGYGIHNIFVFDNQTSYIMFFTFLAYIFTLGPAKSYKYLLSSSTEKPSEDSITVRDYIIVPVIAIALVCALYFVNVRVIQANSTLITALQECSGNTPSIKPFQDALSYNQTTMNQEIREQLVSCSLVLLNSRNRATDQNRSDFYNLTKKEIGEQIQNTPNDARIYVLGGSFFNSIGDWSSALPLLEKARELSPGKQSIAFELANNYVNTNKLDKAVDIIKTTYESAPEYQKAKLAYISVLINNGQENKAHELFPNDSDLFTDQQIINIYASKKRFDKVIEIYKELIKKNPEDPQIHFYLAASYLANKQNWLALDELKMIRDKFPQTKTQMDSIIKDIESGKNPF